MNSTKNIQAYVCLGSNADNAAYKISQARSCLDLLPDIRLAAASPVYLTEPQGFTEQPWFLNQVVALAPGADWNARRLLDTLSSMELALGRTRNPETDVLRYGPRSIDADLLLYGMEHSDDANCRLPHPRMLQRAFVLIPLLDLAPEICIEGQPARCWLEQLAYQLEGNKIFQ
ncbi:2-amino-4-hydroxy-6-hydroxymethyldihydropteridine diphosphokinase [Candidatus Desulfovibrio trichonymphae]|uniref:2-amino-4-hydroxy-6-hydroxymethyldihydropteridine pyrophosphokinase n=1 Tax=Candidatus Desulfovibrio trichonymphae TaxID=1725232 RepID=A0A1J1E344_9BACT|nr:2-amino-4-hydroxy-6-hydroxymethyldihydropteridine diphosphokinase [Candidatus Desulfovibrio trichonymphae]BAV91848.1 2-amino-4-hydroxy-6-hydroxymethyldihydropteridine pyrophosphokinase [Candidatus Desulfovibrio trichonymphae]GHU92013.1 2-amino-4-hydroxy-6-hydroxymethyldihydropteridine diphosphokinase [Deltaproteobacteria bacterium]GHU97927.1 2-amino-4-hydroxy-6-hydroxymethyldihydropteridine diphosphokinase [Deltaproteobacteria bacterium]